MAQSVSTIRTLAAAGTLLALAGAAHAQVTPGSQQWLGLTGASIPPILKAVQANPYRYPAEPACESIPQEIVALNQVLGPDVDGEAAKSSKAHMAMNYARGMIPYRGYVRFLTRADSKDKALQAAATAGYARRGFLRGLEAHLQCASAPKTEVADAAEATAADASAKAVEIKVSATEPSSPTPHADPTSKPAVGDAIARQMLTPVSTAPTIEAAPSDSTHVVYKWVDTTSGQTAVPDPGR